jgi:RNA polymerase sigma-70 factor (ECF subfamily)
VDVSTAPATRNEDALVAGLKRGDRSVVSGLVEAWSTPMLHVALAYVSQRAVAEEVVQDAWVAVLQGIHRFEGRSSVRTWVFRILANLAKTRAVRERRTVPFSAFEDVPAVDPSRFLPDHDAYAAHWAAPPGPAPPEDQLLAAETRARLAGAIQELPPAQRAVVTLRDVLGWTPGEVCAVLDLTDANERVLLHRARSSLRRTLERYLRSELH